MLDVVGDVAGKGGVKRGLGPLSPFAPGVRRGRTEGLEQVVVARHDAGDGRLALGQRTRLVGTEKRDVAEVFERGEPLDDDLLLRQLERTACHSERRDHRQGLGDDGHGQGDHEHQQGRSAPGAVAQRDLDQDGHRQRANHDLHQQSAEGLERLLVLGDFVDARRQGGDLAESGAIAGGVDDAGELTALDRATREEQRGVATAGVVHLGCLPDGHGFTGELGLVYFDIGCHDQLDVGRHDVALF